MAEEEFEYPSRDKIKEELLEKTDFTEDEIETLHWDRIYEIYGRIVRYNEEGVEDEIRSKDWFKDAITEV